MPDPEDDRSVEDACRVYRWLGHNDFKWDYNLARARPTSAVFQHDEMSVVLGDTLAESDRQPEDVANPCLVSLEAGCVRARSQTIRRDPTEDEPAHGLVVGRKTGSVRNALARCAALVVGPDPPVLPARV
jgi:hypothetical protein